MPKATEKEIMKELQEINNLRTFANQPTFLLKKTPINGKTQRRFLFSLERLRKVNGEVCMVDQLPYLPGQLLLLFLQGMREGIKTGTKIAATT